MFNPRPWILKPALLLIVGSLAMLTAHGAEAHDRTPVSGAPAVTASPPLRFPRAAEQLALRGDPQKRSRRPR